MNDKYIKTFTVCDILKELSGNSRYYQINGKSLEEWKMERLEKLAWYEKNYERLKGELSRVV